MDARLSKALRKLQRAVRTLEPQQGRIARRNARKRVTQALRVVRAIMDADYAPVPAEAPPHRRVRRRNMSKAARLERAGWAQAKSIQMVTQCSALGIRCKIVDGRTYLPGWAVTIALRDPRRLAAAKKSIRERKAILTAMALVERPNE